MRLSLEIIVVAIIIMVVAVVVLAIFGGGIWQFRTATDVRMNCIQQGKWSCETSGVKPGGWNTVPVSKDESGKLTLTCENLVGEDWVSCCKWDDSSKSWKWHC